MTKLHDCKLNNPAVLTWLKMFNNSKETVTNCTANFFFTTKHYNLYFQCHLIFNVSTINFNFYTQRIIAFAKLLRIRAHSPSAFTLCPHAIPFPL